MFRRDRRARSGARTLFVEEHGHIDIHTPLGLGPVLGVKPWLPAINEGLFRDLAAAVVKTGQHAGKPMTLEALLDKGELIIRYHEVVTTALLLMMQDAGVEMLSLPTSVVITGVDSLDVLAQNLGAVKSFRPLSQADVAALLNKTAAAALDGTFEPFKTSSIFDSTASHPQWLGDEPASLRALMPN